MARCLAVAASRGVDDDGDHDADGDGRTLDGHRR